MVALLPRYVEWGGDDRKLPSNRLRNPTVYRCIRMVVERGGDWTGYNYSGQQAWKTGPLLIRNCCNSADLHGMGSSVDKAKDYGIL